jgi:hypothetical protein
MLQSEGKVHPKRKGPPESGKEDKSEETSVLSGVPSFLALPVCNLPETLESHG